MSEMDPITLVGVAKRFGKKEVLNGLDLTVPRGSVTALLGRNGAGKSTLLKMLTGLMPRDSGEIRVLGMDPWREQMAVKSAVGYVAESTAFHPRWRVRDAIDRQRRRDAYRYLLALPPVLHRTAKAARYRGSRGEVHQEIRWRLLQQETRQGRRCIQVATLSDIRNTGVPVFAETPVFFCILATQPDARPHAHA